MNCKYSYEFDVRLSQCDFSGKLGLAQCFDLFSDAAMQHMDVLGAGLNELHKRGFFWMVTKTIIEVVDMPALYDQVRLVTWPSAPSHVTYDRNYLIEDLDGKPLVCGKSEWTCISFDTGRFSRLKGIFPEDLEFSEKATVTGLFEKIPDNPFSDNIAAGHTVSITDLDMNRHMNNARFAYAVMNLFRSSELISSPIRSMQILYTAQAREGRVLNFSKRSNDDGSLDIRAFTGDATCILCRVKF